MQTMEKLRTTQTTRERATSAREAGSLALPPALASIGAGWKIPRHPPSSLATQPIYFKEETLSE